MKRKARTRKRIVVIVEEQLALPHEHDEAPEPGARRQHSMVRAERDLRRGLVDTDNYTRALAVTAPTLARSRRRR